jgi:UPF0716 protein FxsA
MMLRWFVIYVVVELAVVVGLASAIGVGWTVLLLLGAFGAGLALAGSQLTRHVRRLRAGFEDLHGAVADSMLVALGTVLVVVPGLVTTALGALLLLPPTRAVVRPVVTALAARRARLITVATAAAGHTPRRGDYIDGEVIDVTVPRERVGAPPACGGVPPIEPPSRPHRPE